jgi:hypothetical protein
MSPVPAPKADPALVTAVRDQLASSISAAIAAGLDSAVELLEHQLEHAREHEKWKPLRDAIDLVRKGRTTLPRSIEAQVHKRFDAKAFPGEGTMTQTAHLSLDDLSLVAEDEVQEEIAIGNSARRLREAAADELFPLSQRLAAVMGAKALADERSPVFPRVFARALLDALSESGAPAATRIAAFAAFSPALLEALPQAYRAGNALLLEHGILPDLRRSYGAPQQSPGARTVVPGAAPPADAGHVAREHAAIPNPASTLFDRLLANAARPAAAVPLETEDAAAHGYVTLHVRAELVEALRSLESRMAAGQLPFPAEPSGAQAPPTACPVAVSDLVRRAKTEMGAALGPDDVVVADLVAAVFDRLFLDPHLSDAVKAQVARLQIPVFKAVMADRAFFTNPAHPIRGLIDTMAALGASGEAHRVDGKLPEEWLVHETQSLLEGNRFDAQAFIAARDRLAAVASRHDEALADADEIVRSMRLQDAELAAVRDASLEIAHRVASTHCPEAAAAFAYHAWRPVLVQDHRLADPGNAQWKADLETLDDLLWTFVPHATVTDRRRLAKLLPAVRYRVKRGLIRRRLPAEEIESLLAHMQLLHEEIERSPVAAAHDELRRTTPLASPARDDVTATLHVSSSAAAEEGVVRGAWFEFTGDDGTKRRARLTWMSPVQGACVFKDLAHNRSFAISLTDLREKRSQGTAVAVDGPGVAESSIEAALQDVARERGTAPA